MKKVSLFLLVLLSSSAVIADNGVEMADQLRSSGKIYVVVAVMFVLFLAFIIYLFSIDRRLKKIEQIK